MVDFLHNGYVLALITLGAMLLQGTLLQNSFYLSVRQGIRIKAAVQVITQQTNFPLSVNAHFLNSIEKKWASM